MDSGIHQSNQGQLQTGQVAPWVTDHSTSLHMRKENEKFVKSFTHNQLNYHPHQLPSPVLACMNLTVSQIGYS